MSNKVFIFDEITVAAEQADALKAAYQGSYAPSARARGMTLEGAWVSPPVKVAGRAVTLHFMWSVADVAAWWAMRLGAADPDIPVSGDEAKLRWWQRVDRLAISRKRTFLRDMEAASDA